MLARHDLSGDTPSPFTIHSFDTLPSTNTEARRFIQEGAPEGTVILARRQTAGRGRQGRSWMSLPGGLLFSIILRSTWPAQWLPRLGFYACVAAALTAEQHGIPRASLKWPNDLVLPLRDHPLAPMLAEDALPTAPSAALAGSATAWAKWGGVLVETGSGQGGWWAIVGVGLNIGPTGDEASELDSPCVSLSDILRQLVDPLPFLQDYLAQFQQLYGGPDGGRWRDALARWRERDILLGRKVEAHTGAEVVRGVAKGINERGALALRTEAGTVWVEAGDVHLKT